MGGQICWKMGEKNIVENICGQTGFTNGVIKWVEKLCGKIVWKTCVKKLGGKLSEIIGRENCTVYSLQCKMYSVQWKVYSIQCTVYTIKCTVK